MVQSDVNITMEINFSSKVYEKGLKEVHPKGLKEL